MATNDLEVILSALGKERQQLHEKLMQMDRIIKKIRTGSSYSNDKVIEVKDSEQKTIAAPNPFPKDVDIKVQILQVMDIVKKAVKLKDIQSHYFRLSGNSYNIREAVRSLNRTGLLKMLRVRTSDRGVLWVKTEWIENHELMNEYKPLGYDVIYKPENMEFI